MNPNTLKQIQKNENYFSSPKIFDGIKIDFFKDSDICDQYLSWLNNRTHMRFSDQRFRTHTIQSAQEYIKSFQDTPHLFLKITRADNTLLGTLTINIDIENCIHTCGILIGTDFARTGLGKKAWLATTGSICPDLGATKIVAGTRKSNLAMVRLFETSNMTLERHLRGEKLQNEQMEDILIYSRSFLTL
jgi:RimJ/RimL family protein N-acetyltransferase